VNGENAFHMAIYGCVRGTSTKTWSEIEDRNVKSKCCANSDNACL
jgi:hypothetical protein